jgi:hypothetical protein
MLTVTMPTTPGESPLEAAREEESEIFNIVKDSCTSDCMQSPNANQVLNQLPSFEIVHFICHGVSDTMSPSKVTSYFKNLENPKRYSSQIF